MNGSSMNYLLGVSLLMVFCIVHVFVVAPGPPTSHVSIPRAEMSSFSADTIASKVAAELKSHLEDKLEGLDRRASEAASHDSKSVAGSSVSSGMEQYHPIYANGGQGPACSLKRGKDDPVPVILLTQGRSGSSSIWQVMGSLTGEDTPAFEYTGSDSPKSNKFLKRVDDDDNGNFVLKYMCRQQDKYPSAGVVGFKWKPFPEAFFHKKSRMALEMVAGSHSIKVVRSQRNILDRALSVYKHRTDEAPAAHCAVDDEECIEQHKRAGLGLQVPVDDLMERLEAEWHKENEVDRLLQELGVPHVKVSFEKLFTSSDGNDISKEWARILTFLGFDASHLTPELVEKAMKHAATSNADHKETIEIGRAHV